MGLSPPFGLALYAGLTLFGVSVALRLPICEISLVTVL